MNFDKISAHRLHSQRVTAPLTKAARHIVSHMVAMQAQDYPMAKWAVGVRSDGLSDADIETAFNKGEVLRTHVLRPTWHFVAAEDIHWLLELTAPRIKVSMRARDKELGITAAVGEKSKTVMENALRGNRHLTRDELRAELARHGIKQNLYHLLMNAELDALICSGAIKGKEQTYALFSERVKKTRKLNREEALAELAIRYFTSRGRAALPDFVWWSGLTAADAKKAVTLAGGELKSEEGYWFSENRVTPQPESGVYLLPAFDEILISYKNRQPSIDVEHHGKAVSNNGTFRPVIMENGRAAGTWARVLKKDTVIIKPAFFSRPDKNTVRGIEEAVHRYGSFLGRKAELKWSV